MRGNISHFNSLKICDPSDFACNHVIYRGKVVQESLIKLVEACSDPSHSVDRWLSKLENSKWLSHVHSALSTAGLVVECVERWGELVLWSFKGAL